MEPLGLRCECGCTNLVVRDLDEQVSFSFEPNYLSKENGRLYRVWNALTDKEIVYAEVLASRGEAIDFLKKLLNELEK